MEKCVTKIFPALTVTGFTNICRRIREHDTFHIVSRDKSPRRDPRVSPLSDPELGCRPFVPDSGRYFNWYKRAALIRLLRVRRPEMTIESKDTKQPKLPAPDFYQLKNVLSADELALKKLCTYMETRSRPSSNKYWADDAFLFELLSHSRERARRTPGKRFTAFFHKRPADFTRTNEPVVTK